MAGGRHIQDRESAMRQGNAGSGIHPNARIVRTAMLQSIAHPLCRGAELLARMAESGVEKPCNATHLDIYPPARLEKAVSPLFQGRYGPCEILWVGPH